MFAYKHVWSYAYAINRLRVFCQRQDVSIALNIYD